ncbi:MAG: transposase [Clostridiaceae bacterium]|nr:transposase [Clostridiaceae bacterium]
MGRKPRVEFERAIYHVIKRGNNREYIFQHKEDKEHLLAFIEAANEDDAFYLLGYVIMDNHYHLMIETKEKPLNKIMQKVNNAYSKNYNKRYQRSDHVFGGRYKAILVKDDKYLFSLLRYIHNNPVRAKMCESIAQYNWSSDQYYRNNVKKLVHIDKILKILSTNRRIALQEYDRFMDQQEPIKKAKDFYEETEVIGGSHEENNSNKSKKYNDKDLDEILRRVVANEEDFQLIKLASRKRYLRNYKISYVKTAVEQGYTFKEIGSNIGVSAEAVNKIIQ